MTNVTLDSILDEGYSALQNQNSNRALIIFSQAVNIYPDNPEIQLGKAIALKQLLKITDAEKTVVQLLNLFPEYNPGKNLLAEIEKEKKTNQIISAEDYLNKYPLNGNMLVIDKIETRAGIKPLKIFKIKNCIIHGRNAVLYSKEGHIFKESSIYEINSVVNTVESLNDKPALNNTLQAECLPLCGLWAEGFWHWMMECIPKAVTAESSGYQGYYLVPPGKKYIYESLTLIGIAPSRILDYNGRTTYVETLVMPQNVQGTSELDFYPGILKMVRDKMFSFKAPDSTDKKNRIYISRKNPPRGGKVVNEDQLIKLLKEYDIERVFMEDLSLKQQIELDMNTEILISPHGAGMVHSLFIRPESLVIELFSPNRIMSCMFPVLNFLKHDYHTVVNTNLESAPYMYGEEIVANLMVLRLILNRWIS